MIRKDEKTAVIEANRIHETDTAYLAACRTCALQAAEILGWKVVPCVDGEGRLRSVEDIFDEIWSLTTPLL